MKLRNYILTGLGLCVLTLAFCMVRYPDFARGLLGVPRFLALMVVVVVWNAYAAIFRTHPVTSEDSMVLDYGVKWGLAIGCAWAIVAMVPINIFTPNDEMGAPLWFLGLFSAVVLPFVFGAAGAIKTGKVRIGMRIGFWSGVVGGLIGFLVVVAAGFTTVLIPGLRGWADPAANQAIVASERIGDTLLLAIYIMFLVGSAFGVIAGTVGGWIGLKLYRTGESPIAVTPPIPS